MLHNRGEGEGAGRGGDAAARAMQRVRATQHTVSHGCRGLGLLACMMVQKCKGTRHRAVSNARAALRERSNGSEWLADVCLMYQHARGRKGWVGVGVGGGMPT